MATVFERVQKVVMELFDVEKSEVTLDASFANNLKADSLDLVELITALEKEFSNEDKTLEIPDEDAERILTVQDAVDYIKSKGIGDK